MAKIGLFGGAARIRKELIEGPIIQNIPFFHADTIAQKRSISMIVLSKTGHFDCFYRFFCPFSGGTVLQFCKKRICYRQRYMIMEYILL